MPPFRPYLLASLAIACGPHDPDESDLTSDSDTGVDDSDLDSDTDTDTDTDTEFDTDTDSGTDTALECDVVATGGRWARTIDLPTGCSLLGVEAGDATGATVDVGDFDGDGQADFAFGAPFNGDEVWPNSPTGRVTVIRGAFLRDSTMRASYYATRSGQTAPYYGRSVAFARDMDGDGADELIVGSAGSWYGVEVLRHGPNTDHYEHTTWTGDSLGSYSPYGPYDGNVGWQVADAGDVNGDGLHDFIAGAPSPIVVGSGPQPIGQTYLIFGPPPSGIGYSFLDEADIRVRGTSGAAVGQGLVGLGDLNTDGNDDFGVADWSSQWNIFYGPGAATLADTDADATLAAYEVAVGGFDVDGDGEADVLFAHSAGYVRAFRGSALLGAVDEAQAFVRIDGEKEGDGFGGAINVADIDGDGHVDLIVGAAEADVRGADAGTVYVFYGDLAGTLTAADSAARFEGDASYSAGRALGAGDLTGDGLLDLVVGNPGGAGEEPNAGFVSVIPGGL